MHLLRQVIGQGDGEIIGCSACGTVQHLIDGQVHHCHESTPFACTIEVRPIKERSQPALSE